MRHIPNLICLFRIALIVPLVLAMRDQQHERIIVLFVLAAVSDGLDGYLANREWAVGDDFSLADCAAAPALFYADWTHAIPDALTTLKAYRARLLARPSFARCVDEARPYRAYFPLGAPDQD